MQCISLKGSAYFIPKEKFKKLMKYQEILKGRLSEKYKITNQFRQDRIDDY